MSASCKYRVENPYNGIWEDIETLTCQFGCCEHGCCTEEWAEQAKNREVSSSELGMLIGIPIASGILLLIVIRIIIYYCRKRQIKQREALLQQYYERCVADTFLEAIRRPRPTIIIHVESEVGQSQPPGGEIELPVAQGPPAYEETTNPPPLFEEATRLSPGSGIMGRGHSGYRRFENE